MANGASPADQSWMGGHYAVDQVVLERRDDRVQGCHLVQQFPIGLNYRRLRQVDEAIR